MADEFSEDDLQGTASEPSGAVIISTPAAPQQVNPGTQMAQRHQAAGMIAPRGHTETAAAATALASMQAAMQLALMNPRDEDLVRSKIHKALQRFEFAEKAVYRYRRGDTQVMGPSVYMARELRMLWGNMLTGHGTVEEDDENRTIRCWAWDLERNVQEETFLTFQKLVQRKSGRETKWVKPDEREMTELNNRMAAKGIRNAILSLLPDDLKRDAVAWANESFLKGVRADPEQQKKQIIIAFGKYNVTPKEIEAFIGRPLSAVGNDAQGVKDLTVLRTTHNRMSQEGVSWHQIVSEKAIDEGLDGPPPASAQELRDLIARRAAEPPPAKSGSRKRGE